MIRPLYNLAILGGSHADGPGAPSTDSQAAAVEFLSGLPADERWQRYGTCNGAPDPDAWYPTPGEHEIRDQVTGICSRCMVRDDCLAYADEHEEQHGIWGGLDYSDPAVRAARGIDGTARQAAA